MSPPSNVLANADVRLMVPMPVTVRLVLPERLQPLAEDNTHVPVPMAIVLTREPEVTKVGMVTL